MSHEGAATPPDDSSKKTMPSALIKFFNLSKYWCNNQAQQALAIEYTRMGFPIFPCDERKVPMVDRSLGFIHGVKDATCNPKLVSRTWFKYPDASIGLAIPEDLIVMDLDVEKDIDKRPVLHDGSPNIIGLHSFQRLIIDLRIKDSELDTLSVKTQSGGRHYFYRMPYGVKSINHTRALEGLDIKGYGGYVILPESQGQYGKYWFLNFTEIRPIPKGLLNWVLQFREPRSKSRKLPTGTANIDREEIVRILTPYWAKADGKRNDFTLAIAGFIARSGGSEDDAVYVIAKLCKLTGRGCDHVSGARYAFHKKRLVKGFRSLKDLMEEFAND